MIVFEIYRSLFHAFQDLSDKKLYFKYKSLVFKNLYFFSKVEIAFHFSILITYCIVKNHISKNAQENDEELFRLYNAYLRKKFFINEVVGIFR